MIDRRIIMISGVTFLIFGGLFGMMSDNIIATVLAGAGLSYFSRDFK